MKSLFTVIFTLFICFGCSKPSKELGGGFMYERINGEGVITHRGYLIIRPSVEEYGYDEALVFGRRVESSIDYRGEDADSGFGCFLIRKQDGRFFLGLDETLYEEMIKDPEGIDWTKARTPNVRIDRD